MPVASVVLPDDHLKQARANLWFVCGISNPQQWQSRYKLYQEFRHHITKELRCNLLTVECALGGGFHCTEADPSNPDASFFMNTLHNGVRTIDVRVRNSSWVWLKEALQNIGAKHLPSSCDVVIFADADIRFLDPNVIENTIYHLNGTYKVVQPFQSCVDMGPTGEVMGVHQSFGYCIQNGMEWNGKREKGGQKGCVYYGLPRGKSGANLFHPGYCLAMKKSTWQKLNGLLEVGIAGAGDHHMCCAMIGRGTESYPRTIHNNYKEAIKKWQERAAEAVRGSFGWINGTIAHSYHGSKQKRGYIQRWDILTKNRFDPDMDVFHNSDGVLELTGKNARLRDELQAYFRSRNEDEGEM